MKDEQPLKIIRRRLIKRICLIMIAAILLLSLSSCTGAEFSFRGSRFGDSMEQVQQNEGSAGEITDWTNLGDFETLQYEIDGYHGIETSVYYYFQDNGLTHICEIFMYDRTEEKQQDIFNDLKKELAVYGKPDQELQEPQDRKALWKTEEYGIVLFVLDDAVLVMYSLDASKAEIFYVTGQVDDWLSEGETVIPTPRYYSPEAWNDLRADSFIPIPEEGCDYIVRDSIREEELAIFRLNPSIPQVIDTLGYPPFAAISSDKQSIYIFYFVEGNKLDLKYDQDLNFVNLDYSGSLTDVPEYNENPAEKPIGIVRDDITRDELSFMDSDTTPEELQAVLGAPHRECYTFDTLFDRMKNDYITFFMSTHFLYPLQDGGILDVHYSRQDNLHVSTARIYESDGQITTLVDRL